MLGQLARTQKESRRFGGRARMRCHADVTPRRSLLNRTGVHLCVSYKHAIAYYEGGAGKPMSTSVCVRSSAVGGGTTP